MKGKSYTETNNNPVITHGYGVPIGAEGDIPYQTRHIMIMTVSSKRMLAC